MPCAVAPFRERPAVYEIDVRRVAEEQSPLRFQVRVAEDDGSTTEHDVTLTRADQERLSGDYPNPEAFIQTCFEFLLERSRRSRSCARST